MSDAVNRAMEIVSAVEWTGDMRVNMTIVIGAGRVLQKRIKELEAENAKLRACLQEIASHSVCCDARHMADNVLKGGE